MMICDSKKMAVRVAIAGALKMNAEGYTFEPSAVGGNVRRADGKGYAVVVPTQELRGDCTCLFFNENWDFGTCKHSVWAGWQVATAAEREAQQAWEDRMADEATERMEAAECPSLGCLPDKWRGIS